MIGIVRAIVAKEVLDGLRDRRSLASALIFPLFGPVLIAFMLGFMASEASEEQALELAIVGAEHAPTMVAALEHQGVVVVDPPTDPRASVESGETSVVLVIPADFEATFRTGRTVDVELIIDSSRNAGRADVRRTEAHLRVYSQRLGVQRLLARGVNPELAEPVEADVVDLATPRSIGANLLQMVTLFVIVSAFVCNMYVAIDTTAGERERGSLEPLLINPVRPEWLVLGKWLATAVYGLAGVALTLVFTALFMAPVPLEELGVSMVFDPLSMLAILVLATPLTLMAGSVQLLVASFASNFKEAQTYLTVTLFLPMIPGMAMTVKPVNTALWMMFVPALSQQVLVTDRMRGDSLNPVHWAISMGSTLALALLFLWLTAQLFRRERVIFGR